MERIEQVRSNGHREYGGEENSDLRHVCGSYVLTQEYSAFLTRTAGAVNEVQGFVRWDLTQLRSRLSGHSPWAFQPMDLLANEIGIQMAVFGAELPFCDSVR